MTHFTSPRRLGAAVALLGLSSFAVLGGACSSTDTPDGSDAEHLGAADQHLIDAQCTSFEVNGKTQICHYTGSASHPYTIIKTSAQGCINGHAGHAHDYIAVGDPTCQGGGCLPTGAPCDATLPCCSGSSCQSGTCVQDCVPTTCAAVGATCGTVSDGCGDTLDCGSCAAGSTCQAGQCKDLCQTVNPCLNGSTCTPVPTGVICTCLPGYVGPNCQINRNDCSPNPCLNGGTCTDGVNSHTCACPAGFTGTNCETAACVPTTCAAQGATCGTIPDGCGGTLTCGSCAAGSACEDGTCQPSGPVCPCEALPGWLDFVVSGTECINYSGELTAVYLYLKDTGSSRGISVHSAIEESPGTPGSPDLCGVVGPNNVGNAFITLDTQDLVNACAQSLSNVASAGGVPCP
ncbi:uncharacterized protein SOCE26_064080 [Sorangium cellulosum]|uniref:EGF-like domain-containing protein n=1 Tax=Sorangium cellulosum TaxID=56 RepID=A0A2L0F047_SORCE|nr:calcium-binding EGF-like domain-containing protein [Sorangium cellulosum]AUX44938.1 uncharacterized protein SOCE26_064080 [Sorangium cellulosum]